MARGEGCTGTATATARGAPASYSYPPGESYAAAFESELSRPLVRRDGYPFERLYHVADSLDADTLTEQGLVPSFERNGPGEGGDDHVARHLRHVYLWPTIEQARRYAYWAFGWGGDMQIWEIDAGSLALQEDPYFVDDTEAATRWRRPVDDDDPIVAWRCLAVEPDRLLDVVETIDGNDEEELDFAELYGDDPDGWPCPCGSEKPVTGCCPALRDEFS